MSDEEMPPIEDAESATMSQDSMSVYSDYADSQGTQASEMDEFDSGMCTQSLYANTQQFHFTLKYIIIICSYYSNFLIISYYSLFQMVKVMGKSASTRGIIVSPRSLSCHTANTGIVWALQGK